MLAAALVIGLVILCSNWRIVSDFVVKNGAEVGGLGVMVVLAVLTFWLAIMWIIFPCLIYSLLNRLIKLETSSNALLAVIADQASKRRL